MDVWVDSLTLFLSFGEISCCHMFSAFFRSAHDMKIQFNPSSDK